MLLTLKNNQTILVRDIGINDAAFRHEFFVQLSLAQQGVVHTLDEIDYHSETSRIEITDFLQNQRGLWLIALEGEKIIGEIDITIKNLARIKHNGWLTIGILPSHQGLGLGYALIEQAKSWAHAHGILRLEITVFQSNDRAVKLYAKSGFVVEGIRRDYVKENNEYINDILMACYNMET
jgi:RimJ/RimL family protein N-acetyltransferase